MSPCPQIVLPPHLERIREKLAENIHELWALTRIEQGWTYGPVRECLQHEGLRLDSVKRENGSLMGRARWWDLRTSGVPWVGVEVRGRGLGVLGEGNLRSCLWGFYRFEMTTRGYTHVLWISTASRSPRGITTCRCRERLSSEGNLGEQEAGPVAGGGAGRQGA